MFLLENTFTNRRLHFIDVQFEMIGVTLTKDDLWIDHPGEG